MERRIDDIERGPGGEASDMERATEPGADSVEREGDGQTSRPLIRLKKNAPAPAQQGR